MSESQPTRRRRRGAILATALAAVALGIVAGPRASEPREPSTRRRDVARPAPGRGAPAARHHDAIRRARAVLAELARSADIPGLSVAVGVRGALAWSDGFGLADLEHRVPVTRETRFRLGSVSKLLTAAAAARLAEAGKLDLDAPIGSYLPDYPEHGRAITTRQLLGHLGGIRHYGAKDYGGGRNIDLLHFDGVRASLELFRDDPLVADPGTAYRYSTFGYTLASAVLEAASGREFLALLREQVFEPLALARTVADARDRIVPDRTGLYERRDGETVHAPPVDASYKWAGGGLLSTAEDLVRFGSAHLAPGYLGAATLETLFTPLRTAAGETTRVGIGWRIGSDPEGRAIVHHAGSMAGCRALLLVYRDAGVVVALLSNLGGTPPDVERVGQEVARGFLEAIEPARAPETTEPSRSKPR